MSNETPSGFRFQIDSENPNAYLSDELEDRRLKKLNSRITRMAIIVPCLIGLVAGWGYYDVRKGVGKLRDMDVSQVENLTKDLNSRLSALSVQNAKLEDSVNKLQGSMKALESTFDKKVMPMDEIFIVFEKTTSAMKTDMQKTEKALADLKAAKIDKTEMIEALDKLDKRVAPVYQHLKNMESEIKALDENLTQELAELSGNYHKVKNELNRLENIQKDISALSANRKGLESDLKNQEKRFQKELQDLKQDFKKELDAREEKIKDIDSQIGELMKFKALSEIKKRLEPPQPSPGAKPPAGPQPSAEQPKSSPTPEIEEKPPPGKILEENLRR